MKPEQLSRQLREGTDEFLSRRPKVAGLVPTDALSMAVISPNPAFGPARLH